jgi:recombination protein RecA
MSSVAVIRAQVERRLPGVFTVSERSVPDVFPTGVVSIDQEAGGIPKGALTQICAPTEITSGRTTLLLSLLAQVTGKDQFCALVDAGDNFDPESAAAMGVSLSHLLWVRCGARAHLKPVEQAFKAADILLQNGGFGVIAIDLGSVEEKLIRKIPLTVWFRFARVIEAMPAALVLLLTHSAAQSCAALTLHVGCATPEWSGQHSTSHGQILSDVKFNLELGRTRTKKPAESARICFSARPQWA